MYIEMSNNFFKLFYKSHFAPSFWAKNEELELNFSADGKIFEDFISELLILMFPLLQSLGSKIL